MVAVASKVLAIPLFIIGGAIELLGLLAIWSDDTSGSGQLSAMFVLFLGGSILALGQWFWQTRKSVVATPCAVKSARTPDRLDAVLPMLGSVSIREARDALFERLRVKSLSKAHERLTERLVDGEFDAATLGRLFQVLDKADVGLREIASSGVVAVPLPLYGEVDGNRSDAILLPDGRLEFCGEPFSNCSRAASKAIRMAANGRAKINGWLFWHYVDAQGTTRKLADARNAYLDFARAE